MTPGLTFSSGDIVTVDNPAQIAVSGSLSANGTTFNYNGGSANLNFTSTGLISGANNIFNLPVIVPYTDVPSLAGNTSFDQVEISAATLSTGTLSLNLLGTNATNFSYQFPNGFTIGSGATLAVGPNVPGLTLGQTLSDAGALTFSSGDVVTVDNPAQIAVSGSLSANGTTFNYNGGSASVVVNSGGDLIASASTFGVPLSLASGSTDNLQYVAFRHPAHDQQRSDDRHYLGRFHQRNRCRIGKRERNDQSDRQFLGDNQPHADRGQDHGSCQQR